MDHGARKHSRYGASIAHRWFSCPGSVRLEAIAPPENPSPSALRGTAAHELLEALIAARVDPIELHALREAADKELLAGVDKCLEHVDLLLDANPDAVMFSEVRFALPSAVVGGEAFGTCDIAIWIPSKRELHIIDYKNGVEVVDEVNNLQLRDYGAGVWFTVPGVAENVERIAITIVQPNAFHPAGHIRTWWTDPDNLIDFMAEFDAAALRAQDENAPLVPTMKNCQYCKAASICPALRAKGLDAAVRGAQDIRLVEEKTLRDPMQMDMAELGYVIAAAPFLERYIEACRDAAYILSMKGHHVPGTKLVAKLSRRKWDGEPAEIAENMMLVYPVELDDIMPRKLLGLTEMEAVISAKVRDAAPRGKKKERVQEAKENMAFFTVKEPATGLTLVPLGDRRPAVNPLATVTEGIQLPVVTVNQTQIGSDT